MTALFHDIIFGPVHSRRLGLSLGVNLLPLSSKLCSFDCIYCECGWNAEHPGGRRFNSREDVRTQLEATLRRMAADSTPPDVITFAGNGEPTMHPDFEAVIGDTIALRDALCPAAKVSVLSNATQIHRDSVRRALLRVDNNILKLDSAFDATSPVNNTGTSVTETFLANSTAIRIGFDFPRIDSKEYFCPTCFSNCCKRLAISTFSIARLSKGIILLLSSPLVI